MILFLRQLWGELVKMSARKRTYVGFGAFLGLEAGLVWILNTPPARRHFQRLIESGGFDFTDYWSMLSLISRGLGELMFWISTPGRHH